MIKAVGDKIVGGGTIIYANSGSNANATSFDAYLAQSRSETVPDTYKTLFGSMAYNHFERIVDLGMPEEDLDSPDQAMAKVKAYAGRVDGGDFKWEFDDTVEDTNYEVITGLQTAIQYYQLTSLIQTFIDDYE